MRCFCIPPTLTKGTTIEALHAMAKSEDNTILKTFEFKLRENRVFIEECERTLNGCRNLYNCALEQRINLYAQTGKGIGFVEQCRQLTDARKELPEVAGVYRDIQTDVLKRLDKAFDAFFRRLCAGEVPGFPRFKGRDRYDSFGCARRERDPFPIKGDKLTMPGVGSCRVRLSRSIEEMGRCRFVRILRRADGWYVQLVCEAAKPEPLPQTGAAVGIDLGIESFATLSNGEQIENPRFVEKAAKKMAWAQRRLSRKVKGSQNRRKARKTVALRHLRTTRARKHFHYQAALGIVRAFDFIAVEDLNVKGLAGGMLAGSVASVAWGAFLMILICKAENAGRQVKKVNPAYTSQDCSGCGERKKKLLSQREHVCTSCGLIAHRDQNAAINILVRARGPEVTPAESDGARGNRNLRAKSRKILVRLETSDAPAGHSESAGRRARL